MSPRFCLEVAGPFACFTRPEMKVERVSYDVMTPSAARAVFESILWKPAIRWRVQRIEVLKPIRFINLRRNEVSAVVSTRNVQGMASGTIDTVVENWGHNDLIKKYITDGKTVEDAGPMSSPAVPARASA